MAKRTSKNQVSKKSQPDKKKGVRKLDAFVIVTALVLFGYGLFNHLSKSNGLQCLEPGNEYTIELKGDAFSTPELKVNRCDVVKVVNMDVNDYKLAFGVHERHITYPGFTETTLRPNEFISVDMLQAGQYRMHDHLRDKAFTEVTVKEKR